MHLLTTLTWFLTSLAIVLVSKDQSYIIGSKKARYGYYFAAILAVNAFSSYVLIR